MAHVAELIVVSEDQRRTSKRRQVSFPASVQDGATTSLKVKVGDLSTTGCKIEVELELQPGAEVWIKLTGMLPVRALVVWHKERQAGCKFCTPIDTGVLESFVLSQKKESKEAIHRRQLPPKVASRPGAKWRLFA